MYTKGLREEIRSPYIRGVAAVVTREALSKVLRYVIEGSRVRWVQQLLLIDIHFVLHFLPVFWVDIALKCMAHS